MPRMDNRPKRVLMVASRFSHLQQFHTPYLRWFAENGWEVEAAAQGMGEFPFPSSIHRMPFCKSLLSLQNIGTIFRLMRLFRKQEYQLVVSHTQLAGFLTKLALVFSGKRATRWVHVCHGYLFRDDGSLKSRMYLFCEKLFCGRSACLLVMNREDEKISMRHRLCRKIVRIDGMGFPEDRFPILTPSGFDAERSRFRKQAGVAAQEIILLCVGEFSPRKNQSSLIRALAAIAEEFPRVLLWFAGEGQCLEECVSLASRLGVNERVCFLGQCKEIDQLLAACDALITASRCEGMPFSVMEALFCGKPVLASRIKGHEELIQDGKNGLLFSLDELGTERAMRTFLKKPGQFKTVTLPEKYHLRAVFPKVLACYLGENGDDF